MRKKFMINFKRVCVIFCVAVIATGLLIYPQTVVEGIRNGLSVLAKELIPSLFPFMVLSSYIGCYSIPKKLLKITERFTNPLFKGSGYTLIPFVLGALGGYPVGAKTVYELYKDGKITQNETERLFYWCINPGPAFCITALGVFMLKSPKSGAIIYISCLLASLTIGIFSRFLANESPIKNTSTALIDKPKSKLTAAVTSGTEAMLSVCGWVLAFSALSSLWEVLIKSPSARLFLQSVCEVTTGCRFATRENLPVTVIAALVGFGGFAVICQCNAYSSYCGVKPKHLICARLIHSALCTIYTTAISNLFPVTEEVFTAFTVGNATFTLYHSLPAAIILVAMCTVFILEVDNKRKVC